MAGIRADVIVWCFCSWTECNAEVNAEMQGDWMKVRKAFLHPLPLHSTAACSTGVPASTPNMAVDGCPLALIILVFHHNLASCIICYAVLQFAVLDCI